MRKLVNKKGFTLIEMLIVVAIVGILVAIAVPTMNSSLDKAHAAADEANLRTAKAQLAAALADPDVTDPVAGQIFDIKDGKFGSDATGNNGECSTHSSKVIAVYNAGTEAAPDLKVGWGTYNNGTFTADENQDCNQPASSQQ